MQIVSVADAIPFDSDLINNIDEYPLSFSVLSGTYKGRGQLKYTNSSIVSTSINLSTNYFMDNTDKELIYITNSVTNSYIRLPDATTLTVNSLYQIINLSNNTINIRTRDAIGITTIPPGGALTIRVRDISTQAGLWVYWSSILGIAQGIVNLSISSSTNFTTTLASYTQITGFSITVSMAGQYQLLFNSSVLDAKNGESHYLSIFVNGVNQTQSERTQYSAAPNQTMIDTTMLIKSLNQGDVISVGYRRGIAGSNLTVKARTLLLIRIGN